MIKTKTILAISLLLTGVFALGLSNTSVFAATNIVTNGSFEETTENCTPPYMTIVTGLTGWTITEGNINVICGYWPASDGDQSIDLTGQIPGVPGAISQDLSTTTGTVYQVDFDMAANSDGGTTSEKAITVSAADSSEIFTTINSAQDGDWEQKTFNFVATNSTTTLEFKSSDPPTVYAFYIHDMYAFYGLGVALDNVSAEAPMKLDVCHKEKNTINISNNAVSAHLGHGDTLGAC